MTELTSAGKAVLPPGPPTLNPPKNDPERSAWFAATTTPIVGGDLLPFWRGVGARNNEILSLNRTLANQCSEEGIFSIAEFSHFSDTASENLVSKIVQNFLEQIPSVVVAYSRESIPEEWLRAWASSLVLDIWWRHQNEGLIDPANTGVALLPPGTHINDMSPSAIGPRTTIQAPPVEERGSVVFKLLVMSDDKRTEIATEKLPAHKALPPNANPRTETNYQISRLLYQFQRALNLTPTFANNKINLAHGAFGYEIRKKFKQIRKQPDFENAVTFLFKAFKKDGELEFTFYMESPSEKKNRENRHKASDRILARKEEMKKKRAMDFALGIVEGPGTRGSRMSSTASSARDKTSQDVEDFMTAEEREREGNIRIASPSRGIHVNSTPQDTPRGSQDSLPLSERAGSSDIVRTVLPIPNLVSKFSISPASPKKESPLKKLGNLFRGKKTEEKKDIHGPLDPRLVGHPRPSTASATSSLKRGANNKPPRPSSKTAAGSSSFFRTPALSPVGPAKGTTSGTGRNRITGIFRSPTKPLPDTLPVDSVGAAKARDEREGFSSLDSRFQTLGKEEERETYLKGWNEEEKTAGDSTWDDVGEDEKLLGEAEGDVVASSSSEFMANQ